MPRGRCKMGMLALRLQSLSAGGRVTNPPARPRDISDGPVRLTSYAQSC